MDVIMKNIKIIVLKAKPGAQDSGEVNFRSPPIYLLPDSSSITPSPSPLRLLSHPLPLKWSSGG